MDVNESDDALVRGRPREDRQHREQQQRGERIASALRAAWITDLGKRGEQERERHQAISTRADAVQTEIRYATMQPVAVKPPASNCLPELQGPDPDPLGSGLCAADRAPAACVPQAAL